MNIKGREKTSTNFSHSFYVVLTYVHVVSDFVIDESPSVASCFEKSCPKDRSIILKCKESTRSCQGRTLYE